MCKTYTIIDFQGNLLPQVSRRVDVYTGGNFILHRLNQAWGLGIRVVTYDH